MKAGHKDIPPDVCQAGFCFWKERFITIEDKYVTKIGSDLQHERFLSLILTKLPAVS